MINYNDMCYTSNRGYKNDVFVSYAHADDEAIMGSQNGWVLNFVDDLEKSLAMKLGKKEGEVPFIWKDEELSINKPLNEELTNEIRQTATYLIIMSPSYLRSDWCKKERKQFFDILKDQNASNRVFIVEIDEIERKEYPTEINENLIPCKFWFKEKGNKARKLGIPKRDTDEYYTRLTDICHDLAAELIRIRNAEENKINNESSKGAVFLAQVTDDLDDKRDEVKRYLKDEGYRVLPEENWYVGDNPEKLKYNIRQAMQNCMVYIQLLSNLPGKKVPGSNDSMCKFQFEIGKEFDKKKIMIWRSPDFNKEKVTDASLKEIHESEFVREEVFEKFKSAILEKLAQKETDTEEKDSKFVYICTDAIDWSYCEEVIIQKMTEKNIDYSLPLISKDPANVRKYQEENLLICDAAVFVYCNSDPNIVLNQIMHCRKISVRRNKPFKVVAIYDGPPPAKDEMKIGFPSLKFSYLNCRNDLNDFTEKFLNLL